LNLTFVTSHVLNSLESSHTTKIVNNMLLASESMADTNGSWGGGAPWGTGEGALGQLGRMALGQPGKRGLGGDGEDGTRAAWEELGTRGS
jgi:hypothetical protein